jgi:hypothetical protein
VIRKRDISLREKKIGFAKRNIRTSRAGSKEKGSELLRSTERDGAEK